MVKVTKDYPIIPLRDVVVFPGIVTTLFVGRSKSIVALNSAMAADKKLVLVAQKDASNEDPTFNDIYHFGTVSNLLQLIKLPDGTMKVLVEGSKRCKIDNISESKGLTKATVTEIDDEIIKVSDSMNLVRFIKTKFNEYVSSTKKIPPEILSTIDAIDDLSKLIDNIVNHLNIDASQKQEILEIFDLQKRSESILTFIESQLDVIDVEKRIRSRVKKQMEKSQREYYLNEKIKAAQKELGEMGDEGDEFEVLKNKIEDSGMSKEALKKAKSEFSKFKMMSPTSAEASVVRSYLECLIEVPWKKRGKVKSDIKAALETLNDDHYGLEEVKDRILEYLAVQKRVKNLKAPVLCLVGPPGVGKTSLGESIARATNRKFIRMSLGGVRDEAEIRGHRRTYIGSMPGKIIQKLTKVGVKNPLFLLDEVDKIGMDHRGDPASALLEVLDPEQNTSFSDHYLEVDYDLSEVMFVCTANSLNIPGPLLDRMEIIRLPGYIEDEKLNIAKNYLVPRNREKNGLSEKEINFSDNAILKIIRNYTREAGVRSLDREINKVCRKKVKELSLGTKTARLVDNRVVRKILGPEPFKYGQHDEENSKGQVNGLAWTSVGGELLQIEAALTAGKGRIIKTGSLGDVMQESIQAALTVAKNIKSKKSTEADFFEKQDLHIHVPEGATPKDGPSAGITMCTAIASLILDKKVKANLAMTGEITLAGKVLKIGGLKEKLIAAKRSGITNVIIPHENQGDLEEIEANILKDLNIHPVKAIEEVLEKALV